MAFVGAGFAVLPAHDSGFEIPALWGEDSIY